MKKIIFLIILINLNLSCSRTAKEEKDLEIVIRAFANNLYTNYHLYSDRDRKDNQGRFQDTWPKTIRVDNPHDTASRKRKKRKQINKSREN